jgi:hypothetical protein
MKYRIPRNALPEAEAGMARALGVGGPGSTVSGGVRVLGFAMSLLPMTAVIDEEGIRIQGVTRPWTDIGLAYETENLICLVVTRNTGPITLPKAELSDTDLSTLRELISRRVVSTPETVDAIRQVRAG